VSLTGVAFALFLPLVLGAYWLLPRRAVLQNAVLLLASLGFYLSWSPEWLLLLIFGTVLDFGLAQVVADERRPTGVRRLALGVAVAANLGALLWFKYVGFLTDAMHALFAAAGLPSSATAMAVVLPLGLSYYTLIRIGYLLDVHHRRIAPSRSLLEFATFVMFFPQIIAGPITRAGRMLPQLRDARRLDPTRVAQGANAFLLGWWMKGYLADWIAPALVEPVFADPGAAGAAAHWLALGGYAVQVFGDFAGYSLLAIGVAALLGLELPVNFDRPFLSRSMPEFWRRWHISLNTWLFDYLYGPWVTGTGWLRGRIALTLVLVFALSGLWHGARWTFVVWGLLHGLALAVHHGWDTWYRARCRVDRRWVTARKHAAYALAAWLLTQAWFLGSLILFRAEDLGSVGRFLRGLLGQGTGFPAEMDAITLVNCAVAFGFIVVHHLLALPAAERVRSLGARTPAALRGIFYGGVIVWLLVFAPLGRGTFIYAQF